MIEETNETYTLALKDLTREEARHVLNALANGQPVDRSLEVTVTRETEHLRGPAWAKGLRWGKRVTETTRATILRLNERAEEMLNGGGSNDSEGNTESSCRWELRAGAATD